MDKRVSLADIKQATRRMMLEWNLISEDDVIQALQYELNELVCYGKDGRFAKCKKGNAYSLSKRGAEALGIDSKYVGKGELTRDEPDEDGIYKMVSKFGQAKGSGRIALPGGEDITPTKRVVGFPTPYSRPPPSKKKKK